MKTTTKFIIVLIAIINLQGYYAIAQEDIFQKQSLTAQDISNHVQLLSENVSRSVVQIFVTSYEPRQKANQLQITKVRGTGSGVIIDPDGYIITNLHVVRGAVRIKVVLPSKPNEKIKLSSIIKPMGEVLEGKIVGVDQETDMAVIRIEGTIL